MNPLPCTVTHSYVRYVDIYSSSELTPPESALEIKIKDQFLPYLASSFSYYSSRRGKGRLLYGGHPHTDRITPPKHTPRRHDFFKLIPKQNLGNLLGLFLELKAQSSV